MNPNLLYRISGIASLVFGLASACCLVDIRAIFYGLIMTMFGFIFSGINIFLNAKYELSSQKLSLGYIGMFLSSLPVIFLMYVLFAGH